MFDSGNTKAELSLQRLHFSCKLNLSTKAIKNRRPDDKNIHDTQIGEKINDLMLAIQKHFWAIWITSWISFQCLISNSENFLLHIPFLFCARKVFESRFLLRNETINNGMDKTHQKSFSCAWKQENQLKNIMWKFCWSENKLPYKFIISKHIDGMLTIHSLRKWFLYMTRFLFSIQLWGVVWHVWWIHFFRV